MDRALWLITVSIALAFICSCATGKPYTYEIRKHSTGIGADEGVVILLNSSRFNDKSLESEGEEKSLEDCVKTGMMKENPRLESVSAKDFRRKVFPDKGFLDSPRSPEDLLSFLIDPDAQSRVMGLGVRYVIILTATNSKGEKVRLWDQRQACIFGQRWFQSSSSDANVLDVKYLRESGSVHAGCSGEALWMAGVGGGACCAFPVIYWTGLGTEAEACSALGKAVMTFLVDGHDMVPTPESGEDLLRRTQEPGRYDKDSQN